MSVVQQVFFNFLFDCKIIYISEDLHKHCPPYSHFPVTPNAYIFMLVKVPKTYIIKNNKYCLEENFFDREVYGFNSLPVITIVTCIIHITLQLQIVK